jgi:hypothetical protein
MPSIREKSCESRVATVSRSRCREDNAASLGKRVSRNPTPHTPDRRKFAAVARVRLMPPPPRGENARSLRGKFRRHRSDKHHRATALLNEGRTSGSCHFLTEGGEPGFRFRNPDRFHAHEPALQLAGCQGQARSSTPWPGATGIRAVFTKRSCNRSGNRVLSPRSRSPARCRTKTSGRRRSCASAIPSTGSGMSDGRKCAG